jgi:hypothetical protein
MDCAVTLQRLYCFFVIEAGSRHVHIPGGHPEPGRAMDNTADPQSPDESRRSRCGFRFLIRDPVGFQNSALGLDLVVRRLARIR